MRSSCGNLGDKVIQPNSNYQSILLTSTKKSIVYDLSLVLILLSLLWCLTLSSLFPRPSHRLTLDNAKQMSEACHPSPLSYIRPTTQQTQVTVTCHGHTTWTQQSIGFNHNPTSKEVNCSYHQPKELALKRTTPMVSCVMEAEQHDNNFVQDIKTQEGGWQNWSRMHW